MRWHIARHHRRLDARHQTATDLEKACPRCCSDREPTMCRKCAWQSRQCALGDEHAVCGTGRDKHLELVETRRSAPSVETLKSTDTTHELATSPARTMSRCGACSHKQPHGHWRCGLLTSDVAKNLNHGRPCLVGFWHRRKAVAASGEMQLCCERHAHMSNQPSASASAGAFMLHLRRGRITCSCKCGAAADGCAQSSRSRTCLI